MRRPTFTKGPWSSTFTLGNGAFRILSRRGYVATVESPDDARLIKKAPELYRALATVADDIEKLVKQPHALNDVEVRWLAQGLKRIDELLNEVDGK